MLARLIYQVIEIGHVQMAREQIKINVKSLKSSPELKGFAFSRCQIITNLSSNSQKLY